MNIEIRPELGQRLTEQIRSGRFHDADELLSKALDALQEKEDPSMPGSAQTRHATGAALLAVLQASPCREIDLTPRRERLPVRDVII
jgi:Arc/MetJ-type ribon-helix-helix transcriptional regulator